MANPHEILMREERRRKQQQKNSERPGAKRNQRVRDFGSSVISGGKDLLSSPGSAAKMLPPFFAPTVGVEAGKRAIPWYLDMLTSDVKKNVNELQTNTRTKREEKKQQREIDAIADAYVSTYGIDRDQAQQMAELDYQEMTASAHTENRYEQRTREDPGALLPGTSLPSMDPLDWGQYDVEDIADASGMSEEEIQQMKDNEQFARDYREAFDEGEESPQSESQSGEPDEQGPQLTPEQSLDNMTILELQTLARQLGSGGGAGWDNGMLSPQQVYQVGIGSEVSSPAAVSLPPKKELEKIIRDSLKRDIIEGQARLVSPPPAPEYPAWLNPRAAQEDEGSGVVDAVTSGLNTSAKYLTGMPDRPEETPEAEAEIIRPPDLETMSEEDKDALYQLAAPLWVQQTDAPVPPRDELLQLIFVEEWDNALEFINSQ